MEMFVKRNKEYKDHFELTGFTTVHKDLKAENYYRPLTPPAAKKEKNEIVEQQQREIPTLRMGK